VVAESTSCAISNAQSTCITEAEVVAVLAPLWSRVGPDLLVVRVCSGRSDFRRSARPQLEEKVDSLKRKSPEEDAPSMQ
jgi:hypothetical protein